MNLKFKLNKFFIHLIILIIIVSVISLNVHGLTFLSPIEKSFETNNNKEKLKINIDYINPYNDIWIEINNEKIDLNKSNLIEKSDLINNFRIVDSQRKIELEKISNYIEYSFNIVIERRGTFIVNLGSNREYFGIKYLNNINKQVWQCYDGSEYVDISNAKEETEYNFLIKVFNDGRNYYYYEVYNNNRKLATCKINGNIEYIDNIFFDGTGNIARINNQKLKTGSHNIKLPPGRHKATLTALDNENNEISISREFNVIIQDCGNLICRGNNTYLNCPSDCVPFECDDNALIGDTNNDGIINEVDRKNLVNIKEGRLPYPKKDCCVDLTGDKKITSEDLKKIDKIISGEIQTQVCFIDCIDGTIDQSCSVNKPYFCDYKTLIEKCELCSCPKYMTCQEDGTCKGMDNFEIIIEKKDSNESNIYIKNGIIYFNLYNNSNQEIDFIINPLRDLENLSLKINLDKNGIEFNNIKEINNKYSKKINLNKNKQEKIVINFEDNNNTLGTYNGQIDILINEYIFYSIPIVMEIKEKIPEPIIKEKIDYRQFIPYVSALILMIIILIHLLFKRRKERRMIKELEIEHKIILR